MPTPPINPAAEAAVAVIKGIVSTLVPVYGGVLSELGNLVLNPLERRKQAWMIEVSAALNTIEQRYARLPIDLQHDDEFITFLFQATSAAMKTHQAIKLRALRNALANSAAPGPRDADAGLQYLRYIDELSPTHLSLLAALEHDAIKYALLTSLEELVAALTADCVLTSDRDTTRAYLQDLEGRFLIRLGDLDELPEYASKRSLELREESAVQPVAVTAQGSRFLSFVRS